MAFSSVSGILVLPAMPYGKIIAHAVLTGNRKDGKCGDDQRFAERRLITFTPLLLSLPRSESVV